MRMEAVDKCLYGRIRRVIYEGSRPLIHVLGSFDFYRCASAILFGLTRGLPKKISEVL